MSSQAGRPSDRGYHQDYIARIRYENTLPPPPGAPKLLNIPIEGLSYYTSAAFASRMARRQPLNIEADAELGMPIDLVGMPGIFDGDESSIQAPLAIPPIHPKDKALLRPLAELGKPKFSTGGHSFLRRTEYISSEAKARAEANATNPKSSTKALASKVQKRPADQAKEDPINILRHVIKGFDLANPDNVYTGEDDPSHLRGAAPTPAEKEAWLRPRHPTKPDVKLLESYPILPDLTAMTDPGSYMVIKYSGNPNNLTKEHDPRMDVGLLQPVEKSGDDYDYEYYLPEEEDSAIQLKRKFDSVDEADENEADEREGGPTYRYLHNRTYELVRQTDSTEHNYREIALALHDEDSRSNGTTRSMRERHQKGAYYYPINLKMQLKPKRNKNLANLGMQRREADEESTRADEINLSLRQPTTEEAERRKSHREELISHRSAATNGETHGSP